MELHCKGETNKYFFYKEHTIRNMQKKYQGVIGYRKTSHNEKFI